jgi:hypothetical protein
MTQVEGYEAAHRALVQNTSLRQARLENLERWAEGSQYDGRPSWWDGGEKDVPLWERAPCVVYPVVRIAIQSNTDLVLGEGRFPVFSSKPGEAEGDEENGLSEEDSVVLDRFIVEHHRLSMFRAHCRYAFSSAQASGAVLAVHGVRNGRPIADLIPAKWATPKLDALGAVLSVEIRYPYIDEQKKPSGGYRARAMLYRRVIDSTRDVTFYPAEAQETGAEPDWKEDPALTVDHALGFCPAVWYPFMRGCVPVNQIDGNAIHAHLLDEIQAHDIALSQRHRGALFSEPQICEIGVQPGYSPTDLGRTPTVPASAAGGAITPQNPQVGGYLLGVTYQARKKGPGYPWQYPNPMTKVELLTYPGEALKAQDDNARDLRMKLQESLCVVFLDPESIKFASTTSGKALEAIKQKQLDRCDQYRDDLRDNFLLPSVDMQLRIAHKLGKGLRVPGIAKALPILKKFGDDVDQSKSAA